MKIALGVAGVIGALLVAVALVWWLSNPQPIVLGPTTDYLLDWQERVTIDTRQGAVTGLSNGTSIAFLAVPFARPPVGELRFRPPAPASSWTETLDATRFADICIQGDPPFGDPDRFTKSEDCLYLNVFTPDAARADRPVLSWIHGGSFVEGSANGYDGSVLAEQGDVVVVVVNYRLGMLGFLDLSAYGDEFAGSAANGIRDQIQALRWVHDNIADYGGDAGNVTIFGESAGGQSVLAILASPAADGLYHKAITHSGGAVNAPPQDGRAALAEHFDVAQTRLLDKLQSLPAEELLAAQATAAWGGGGSIDGTVVTRSVMDAIIERGAAGVPLIAGSNLNEGTLFSHLIPWYVHGLIGELVAQNIVEDMDGAAYIEALKQAYPDNSAKQTFERVWTDLLVRGGVNAAARASAAGPGGWLYRFDLPVQRLPGLGATHAAEIGFTFNQFARELPATAFLYDRNDPVVRRLALNWSNTVLQFARTGNPNGAGLPEWPRYSAESRLALILDDNPRITDNVHAIDRTRWGDTEVLSSQYMELSKEVVPPLP